MVWVVPLSDCKFTPTAPFPSVVDSGTFGVGQGTEGFPLLIPRSVSLPLQTSQLRLDYGQFRQEPAITSLDWLFTPSPKLEEHLSVEPLQASTRFYPHFTLLRARSTSFGLCPCDLRRFHTYSLIACGTSLSLWVLFYRLPSPQR